MVKLGLFLLGTLAVFSGTVGCLENVPEHEVVNKIDIQELFNVILDEHPSPNDPKSKGNCFKWKHRIEQGYLEALGIVASAIEALQELQGEVPDLKSPEYQRYSRVAQPFWLSFTIVTDENTMKAAAKHVEGLMQMYYDWHVKDDKGKPKVQGKPKVHLRCDDDFLIRLGPNDPDPRDKGTPLEGKYTLAKPRKGRQPMPKGGYWAANVDLERNIWPLEYFDPDHLDHPICGAPTPDDPITHAELLSDNRLMVLCPRVLNNLDWSVDTLRKRIVMGFQKTSIEFFGSTLAKTLVHEMAHYVIGFPDQAALDAQGREILTPTHETQAIWGISEAWLLARYLCDKTVESPENLAYYALMMYLEESYWGRGYAEFDAPTLQEMRPFLMTPAQRHKLLLPPIIHWSAAQPPGRTEGSLGRKIGQTPSSPPTKKPQDQAPAQAQGQQQAAAAAAAAMKQAPAAARPPQPDPQVGSSKGAGSSGGKSSGKSSGRKGGFKGLFGGKNAGKGSF